MALEASTRRSEEAPPPEAAAPRSRAARGPEAAASTSELRMRTSSTGDAPASTSGRCSSRYDSAPDRGKTGTLFLFVFEIGKIKFSTGKNISGITIRC